MAARRLANDAPTDAARDAAKDAARGGAGRAPSMSDVAALAGVSHQTVSRVLAGHPNVRPRTRARVLTAVAELGYRPNTAARTLATGRSRTLGVVSMNSTLYGPASTLYSIEAAAKLAGYFVTVASVRSFDRTSLHEATARLLSQAVDGLVIIAPLASAVDALRQAHAEVPPLLNGDWSARSGYQAGQVLARMPDVTAVFAANDQMALGLLRALGERCRLVPAEVSVVGFDDIPEAAFYTPPLTTVRQDFDAVGKRSLHMLVEQITAGPSGTGQVLVGTELIVRQSTGPAPRRA